LAKQFIIESATGEKIPFLRGVLVESLVRAGLTFQDAFVVAQSVRDKLENDVEVTTDELRKRVSAELRADFGASVARAYDLGTSRERQIMVQNLGDVTPFSAGLLSRALQACAINRTDALETAKQVQELLLKGDLKVVDHLALKDMVYQCLQQHCSQAAADRYLSWRRFKESGLPLIVLVGGITGTGKSTLTTELAYQLNIVRTQSTDMMREIVRCYLPPEEIPTLYYSSFEAWRGLASDDDSGSEDKTNKVIRGFLSQFNIVKPGLEATINRAVKESHDLIIDGVHVLPWRLDTKINPDQAIVVPMIMVVPNKKTLGKRLKHREREQPERASSRYLKQLEKIWLMQSHLVAEAEEHGVPLIINTEIEESLEEILMHISNALSQRFSSKP